MPIPGMLQPLRSPTETEVHVWTVLVSKSSDFLPDLQCLLSPEERAAAARFVYPADRVRYTVAHGILRRILGEYLSLPPEELKFEVSQHGKPALASRTGQPSLNFNLAHSGDVVVYGVTRSRLVGIDVEEIRSEIEVMDLARHQFSKAEADALEALDESERIDAFFRCWTRKEAYLKARGEGLGYPLNHFSVSVGGAEKPALLWVKDEPNAGEKWSLFHLNSPPGYMGAAMVEGTSVELRLFQPSFF